MLRGGKDREDRLLKNLKGEKEEGEKLLSPYTSSYHRRGKRGKDEKNV